MVAVGKNNTHVGWLDAWFVPSLALNVLAACKTLAKEQLFHAIGAGVLKVDARTALEPISIYY